MNLRRVLAGFALCMLVAVVAGCSHSPNYSDLQAGGVGGPSGPKAPPTRIFDASGHIIGIKDPNGNVHGQAGLH
jgi:hypothetical protein